MYYAFDRKESEHDVNAFVLARDAACMIGRMRIKGMPLICKYIHAEMEPHHCSGPLLAEF